MLNKHTKYLVGTSIDFYIIYKGWTLTSQLILAFITKMQFCVE